MTDNVGQRSPAFPDSQSITHNWLEIYLTDTPQPINEQNTHIQKEAVSRISGQSGYGIWNGNGHDVKMFWNCLAKLTTFRHERLQIFNLTLGKITLPTFRFFKWKWKAKMTIHTEIAITIAIVISILLIAKYAYICSPTSNCIVFEKHYAPHYVTAMLIWLIEMERRSFKVMCLVLNFLWHNCKQWAVTANGQRGWMLTGHGHTTHHRALIQHIVD